MGNKKTVFTDDLMTDDLMKKAVDKVVADEKQATVRNVAREEEVLTVYELMKQALGSEDENSSVHITYSLNTPFASTGSVSITGEEVVIRDMASFAKAISLASNWEVYPKTDGTIQINFGFFGLREKPSNRGN